MDLEEFIKVLLSIYNEYKNKYNDENIKVYFATDFTGKKFISDNIGINPFYISDTFLGIDVYTSDIENNELDNNSFILFDEHISHDQDVKILH